MKHKIIGLTVGVLLAASLSAMADTINVKDHYREVIYLEPYTVEVCSKQQVNCQELLLVVQSVRIMQLRSLVQLQLQYVRLRDVRNLIL